MAILQGTRKAKKGYGGSKAKTIYVDMGIWLDGTTIHMTVPTDKKFHTTVSSNPKSKRHHPNLYMKLEQLLRKHGVWN